LTHTVLFETSDEYFEYPSHASRQGRWNIYGLHLPDDVLRKIYRENAPRLLILFISVLIAEAGLSAQMASGFSADQSLSANSPTARRTAPADQLQALSRIAAAREALRAHPDSAQDNCR
jgi:hypothetical protein